MGIEALLGLYGSELPPDLQPVTVGRAMVRTGHVVVGAFILAASVVAAVQAYRAAVAAVEAAPRVATEACYAAVRDSRAGERHGMKAAVSVCNETAAPLARPPFADFTARGTAAPRRLRAN